MEREPSMPLPEMESEPHEESSENVEREPTPTERVAAAQGWDDLFETLRDLESLQGSQKEYTAADLISKIEDARDNAHLPILLSLITNTAGLRDKVTEMIQAEPSEHTDQRAA